MRNLSNTYYAFRHGESRANVEGIIVSDPAVGTVRYGLTEEGRRQVRATVAGLELDGDAVVVSSNFRRARETAELIREELEADPVVVDERLRERFFGEFEGKSHDHYSETWESDLFDPGQEFKGAESTASVRRRMWDVVETMEGLHAGRAVVLVSHGDPLMLLQTVFEGIGPDSHRSLEYIPTGGCRCLNP